ncbi:MAG: hypothetical protein KBH07_08600 [Flavobacteriales bacterium]|nr:hypothetical protein [Flavobacteriales bacterium]MBP9079253.1 hypothetical protein [Flavobacteriales bacterium]
MKKLMTTIALVALTATFAQAQEKVARNAEARAEANHERIVKSLGLDQDQTAKVKEINADYRVKLEELKAAREAGTDVSGKRKDLEKARLARYKGVLTPEQYSKLETKLKEEKAERKAKKQGATKQAE